MSFINRHIINIISVLAVCVISSMLLEACNLTDSARLKEEDYREQGIALMQAGKYNEAATMLQMGLDQSVGFVTDLDVDICYYRAAALFAAGDTDEALAVYDNIIDYDEKDWRAYYLRGTVYLLSADMTNAVLDYDTAISLDEKDADLYIQIYENIKETDLNKAQEYLDKGAEAGDDDPCAMGYIYYLKGNTDSALTLLQDAADENNPRACYYLGQIYIILGNYTDALNIVNKGLYAASADASGSFLKYLKWLQVVCYEYTGDFERAKSLISDYVELYPEDPLAVRENTFLQTR